MSLFPEIVEGYTTTTVSIDPTPSMTYSLDFDSGIVGGVIDGETAIRQAVHKAIITNMDRPRIYDGAYGSELDSLIGSNHSIAYLKAEIPRMVRDALIYDDRIDSVGDFEVSTIDETVYVTFTVVLSDKTEIAVSEVVTV